MGIYNYNELKKYNEANVGDILVKCNATYYETNMFIVLYKADLGALKNMTNNDLIKRENDVNHPKNIQITIVNPKNNIQKTFVYHTIVKGGNKTNIQKVIRYAYQDYNEAIGDNK